MRRPGSRRRRGRRRWPRSAIVSTEAIADHRKDESRPVRLPLVWSDIPALLVPMVRIGDRGAVRLPAPGQGYTIALLDESVLVRELIPMLAERHFGQGQDAAVYAAVVGPRGPIYTAPDGAVPPALLTAPDAKFDLFEIRFGDFNRFVTERKVDASGATQTRTTVQFSRDDRARGFRGPEARPSRRRGTCTCSIRRARLTRRSPARAGATCS